MNIDDRRFDELLNDLRPHGYACFCGRPGHEPNPAHTTTSNEWDAVTAVYHFNFELHDAPPVEAPPFSDGAAWNDRHLWIKQTTPFPARVFAHELAHLLLGHCDPENQPMDDGDMRVVGPLDEIDAEATALLVVDALGCGEDHRELSRQYIAAWGGRLRPTSRPRIKDAARRILDAGRRELWVAA